MEGKKISQLTPDTSPSTDDFIVTVDGTTMQNKRVDLGSLPVSTPTNALFDTKVDKAPGKQLSDNNYTQDEKNKLAGIEAGAEVNEVTTAQLNGKRNLATGTNLVYTTNGAGTQATEKYDVQKTGWALVQRDSSGIVRFSDPVSVDQGATKGYVDRLVPLKGTGFPNGVISATPGRIYIDENITNGASSWIKKSGAGNTGWVVLEGDTGRRDVGDVWLAPGIAKLGVLAYRRIGKISYLSGRVQLSTEAATGTRGSNKPLIIINNTDMLPGWGYFQPIVVTSNTGVSFPGRVATINDQRQLDAVGILSTGNWTLSDQFQINLLWTETSVWPTTLPGVSA